MKTCFDQIPPDKVKARPLTMNGAVPPVLPVMGGG
jgi:methylmalonyl-CoA mutase N-terminal domain/subunit